jgi:hypothetical protein
MEPSFLFLAEEEGNSWRTGLLCTQGGKSGAFLFIGPPIGCRYRCARDSLTGSGLKTSPARNEQMVCILSFTL